MSDTLPYTAERHFALREAHNIAAGDAYFEVRPHLTASGPHRLTFDAGFVRGFDKGTELADARALAARQQATMSDTLPPLPAMLANLPGYCRNTLKADRLACYRAGLEAAAKRCEQYRKDCLAEERPIAYAYGAADCAASINQLLEQAK